MSENRPIHEIRLGRVKAAIWQNETENGTWLSVAITRLYRKDDKWETTTSFSRDDLPLVAKVADLAHTWIYQQGSDSTADSSESQADSKPQTRKRRTATAKG